MAYPDDEQKDRLIRLHPESGGKLVDLTTLGNHGYLGEQKFQGVSSDVFIYLDRGNYVPYIITRKLNVTIQIDPDRWSVPNFLSYLTVGPIVPTKKCTFHGDEDTGVTAHRNLEQLLKPHGLPIQHHSTEKGIWSFIIGDMRYQYYSIGIAANSRYGAVSTRQGNDSENKSSHFEIKFKRVGDRTGNNVEHEYVCLNIHLLASPGKTFGQQEVIERLDTAIRLFYHELRLLQFPNLAGYKTDLRNIFCITLDNYEKYKFSCKHPKSIENLDGYKAVRPYLKIPQNLPAAAAAAPKPPSQFVLNQDDFPSL